MATNDQTEPQHQDGHRCSTFARRDANLMTDGSPERGERGREEREARLESISSPYISLLGGFKRHLFGP